ncbi:MAG: MoaD/ThiS family protein [Anaerolineae bacterium]
MQVAVRFAGPLRTLAGCQSQLVTLPDEAVLRDLLHHLADVLPASFRVEVLTPLEEGHAPLALLLVNGASLRYPQDLDRPLANGDVVAFVPPMAGG